MQKKITQKLTKISKKRSIMKVYIDHPKLQPGHGVSAKQIIRSLPKIKELQNADQLQLMASDEGGFIPLVIWSEDPSSQHYNVYMSNSGMLDGRSGKPVTFKGIARKENTSGGASTHFVDREVYDANEEVHLQMSGQYFEYALFVHESNVYDSWQGEVAVRLGDCQILKAGFASVSQKRAGDIAAVLLDVDLHTFLKEDLGFDFNAFIKTKDGQCQFDAVKSASRTKLAASSGKKLQLF